MTSHKENPSATNTEATNIHIPSQHVENQHNPIADDIQDNELVQEYAHAREGGECLNMESLAQNTGKSPIDNSIDNLKALGHSKRPLLTAIRANCVECCGDKPSEVRLCTCKICNLWPYRMGSNPFRQTSPLSEKQRIALKNGRVS